MDKLSVLRAVPLFADLEERELQAVAVLAREVDAPAGEVLMLEGEPGDAFYVIVEGTVHVDHGGRTVRSLTAGGFLGEIALLEHGVRTATATCATDCRLLALRQHEFDRLVESMPSVRDRVRRSMERRRS